MIQIRQKMLCNKVQNMMNLKELSNYNRKISMRKSKDTHNKTKKIWRNYNKILNNKLKLNMIKKSIYWGQYRDYKKNMKKLWSKFNRKKTNNSRKYPMIMLNNIRTLHKLL